MKVIFLDIDGVLNNGPYLMSVRYGRGKDPKDDSDMIDSNAIDLLNYLIEQSKAVIVITSSWRILHTLPDISRFFKKCGFANQIIGTTPVLSTGNRGDEIQAWIDACNGCIKDFVILDDNDDMGKLKHKLVQTKWDSGLTKENVQEALKILNLLAREYPSTRGRG